MIPLADTRYGTKGNAGTISTGKGDRGGKSYGLYQFSSSLGIVAIFIRQMGYTQAFAGLAVGSEAFDKKWKELAQNPQFAEDQHTYIQNHYYRPQMNFLNNHGIPLDERGPAIQDMVWSTAVQFGPGTSMILKALRGKNVQEMTDQMIVTAVQDYKIKFNNQFFIHSSEAVRKGTLERAKQEKEALLDLIRESGV